MTRISISALTMALLIRRSDALCSGDINLGATCDLASLEAAIAGTDCTVAELFPGEDAATAVDDLCEYGAPTQFVEIQGTYQLDKRAMNGGGDVKDGENTFEIDVARLKRFIDNDMDNKLIAWPEYAQREAYNPNNGYGDNGYMTNFNIDQEAEKGSCQMNTVMCCFIESEFDDLVKNTDVCRHDLANSPQSNHIKAGWSVFSGDEPANCMGFTWKEGDASDTYKGNTLFYTSLYQTAMKGKMSNVPGAPMCACVEQMPIVTKADCVTSTGSDLSYKITVDASALEVTASASVTMTYGTCGDNDLKAQVKALHAGTDIATGIDEYLVGDGNCDVTNEAYLNDVQLLVPSATNELQDLHGVEYEGRTWKQLFGEGIYFLPPDMDAAAGDAEMRADLDACLVPLGRYCMILRKCVSCTVDTHKEIIYQRLTPFNDFQEGISTDTTMDIPNLFMNQWRKLNNEMHEDYELYSSVGDALTDSGAWEQADYNTNNNNYGFPRNSGPITYVHGQWNSYKWSGGYAHHHAFYIEVPP